MKWTVLQLCHYPLTQKRGPNNYFGVKRESSNLLTFIVIYLVWGHGYKLILWWVILPILVSFYFGPKTSGAEIWRTESSLHEDRPALQRWRHKRLELYLPFIFLRNTNMCYKIHFMRFSVSYFCLTYNGRCNPDKILRWSLLSPFPKNILLKLICVWPIVSSEAGPRLCPGHSRAQISGLISDILVWMTVTQRWRQVSTLYLFTLVNAVQSPITHNWLLWLACHICVLSW